ncbi:MAG: ATP-binding cassette domain-containing protein [Myxococcota bacterium]
MDAPLLEVRGLDVAAPDGTPLLAGVSLTLEAGEERLLVGPSGLGKSTLLRTLAGLHAPPGEAVRLRGRTLRAHGAARWRRQLTYAHQKPTLGPETVLAALARPFAYAAAGAPFDGAAAKAALEALGLPGDVGGRAASSLSVGEQQRVHVLRALLVAEAVALLDEPDASLDAATAERLDAYLARRRDAGLAVLRISHRPPAGAGTFDLEPFRAPGRANPAEGAAT